MIIAICSQKKTLVIKFQCRTKQILEPFADQSLLKYYNSAWAVYWTLTLAHPEGVSDRGLPSVDLALVAV